MIDIKKEKQNLKIEEYSNKLDKSKIGGTLPKKFIRADSEFFGDLWDRIEKGETACRTYIDKEIKEGYRPKFVSCALIKMRKTNQLITSQERVNNVMIASQMAELLKVPYAYSIPVRRGNVLYMMSVDFVPYGYKMKTLTDLMDGSFISGGASLQKIAEEAFKSIFKKTNNIEADKKFDYVSQKVDDLIEEAVFKKYMIGDADGCSDNIGALVSENDIIVAPVFDSEYSFSYKISEDVLKKDFQYLMTKHPKVFEKFANNIRNVSKNNYQPVVNIVNEHEENAQIAYKKIVYLIQNLTSIDNVIYQLQSSKFTPAK